MQISAAGHGGRELREVGLLALLVDGFDAAAGRGAGCSLGRLSWVESRRFLQVLHRKRRIFHARCRNATTVMPERLLEPRSSEGANRFGRADVGEGSCGQTKQSLISTWSAVALSPFWGRPRVCNRRRRLSLLKNRLRCRSPVSGSKSVDRHGGWHHVSQTAGVIVGEGCSQTEIFQNQEQEQNHPWEPGPGVGPSPQRCPPTSQQPLPTTRRDFCNSRSAWTNGNAATETLAPMRGVQKHDWIEGKGNVYCLPRLRFPGRLSILQTRCVGIGRSGDGNRLLVGLAALRRTGFEGGRLGGFLPEDIGSRVVG